MCATRSVYIAATAQDEGKTTTVLGFLQYLKDHFSSVGFMKPVGQRYVTLDDGTRVDKDAWLIKEVFGLSDDGADISPIIIPRGFTRTYIDAHTTISLEERVTAAYSRVSRAHQAVVIEGTGHAGVGSVIDMSNARVAALLNAPVILVSGGGIGKPVDSIVLNASLFRAHDVYVCGAFINKVSRERCDEVRDYAARALACHDIPLLGVLPYTPLLSCPTLRETARCVDGRFICGDTAENRLFAAVTLACMYNHDVLARITQDTLVVTTAEATDILLACAGEGASADMLLGKISAVLLVEGYTPKTHIVRMLERADIPVIVTDMTAYDATRSVAQMVAKTQPDNPEKMAEVHRVFTENTDLSTCMRMLW